MVKDTIIGLISELEGRWDVSTLLPGDRGGWTQGGISARAYPELADRIRAGKLKHTEIRNIYFDDYYARIHAYEIMEERCPEILALLFFGKVHGIGISRYTKVIQQWLNSNNPPKRTIFVDSVWGPQTSTTLLRFPDRDLDRLLKHLENQSAYFIRERVNATRNGKIEYVNGMTNRITNEFLLASVVGDQEIQAELEIREAEDLFIERQSDLFNDHSEAIRISNTLTVYV
jgi:lysozyme family protein